MDSLIDATEYGSSSAAFFAYEDYAARQLPLLWLPNASYVFVYKKQPGRRHAAEPVLRHCSTLRSGTTRSPAS